MHLACTLLILLARVPAGEVAIAAHQIHTVEDVAGGALVTTERGAAWRVQGSAREVADQVREQCAAQQHQAQRGNDERP
jgi:hypothetical protein